MVSAPSKAGKQARAGNPNKVQPGKQAKAGNPNKVQPGKQAKAAQPNKNQPETGTEEALNQYDFTGTDAGASHTIPSEAGQIRKGGYIVIKGHPCKVVNVSTSKTGKHGHAKANFTATDIFTGKKLEDVIPSTHTTSVPIVKRCEYGLLDICDDDFLSLLSEASEVKNDLQMPEYPKELKADITTAFEAGQELRVTVMSAMGIEQVVSFKEVTQ